MLTIYEIHKDGDLIQSSLDRGELQAIWDNLSTLESGTLYFVKIEDESKPEIVLDTKEVTHEDDLCQCGKLKRDWQGHCDNCNAIGDIQRSEHAIIRIL